jgi:molybdopterin-containing oxidoreductase family membrane subunit
MKIWPNFKSALPWDFAAISTYFTVSLLFWFVGLIPDLAVARERARSRAWKRLYGVLALGWSGSQRDWRIHRIAYLLLAGLATPLVISVHSVVSLDFASTVLPGWHSTIFPPYFVAGALYSGFAMTLTLVIPVRHAFGLERVITTKHLERLALLMLATGWIVIASYAIEFFVAWYSGDELDRWVHFAGWPRGRFGAVFAVMLAANVLVPQVLWSRRARRSPAVLLVAALLINAGMWAERFVIVVASLHRDFLPSSWGDYAPTWVDLGLLGGTISFFLLLFLLFLRFVPFVPISETKELKAELEKEDEELETRPGGVFS